MIERERKSVGWLVKYVGPKKFKVKELRFSNLLVEDINVPKNLIV